MAAKGEDFHCETESEGSDSDYQNNLDGRSMLVSVQIKEDCDEAKNDSSQQELMDYA